MNTPRALVLSSLGLAMAASFAFATGCTQGTDNPDGSSEGALTAGAVVGHYELDSPERTGSLDIKAATTTSMTFDIQIVNAYGGSNEGDIADATATGSRGVYTYKAKNCTLTLTLSGASIAVDQQGSCDFGLHVIATGTFKPKKAEPAAASLCSGAEQVIFSCQVARSSKTLSICGYKGAAQYRFGTPKNVEVKLPSDMQPTFDQPEIAEGGSLMLAGAGAGGAFATFHNGNFDYTVFTKSVSKGLDAKGRSLGLENSGGVVVFENQKRIAFLKCANEATSNLPSEIIAPSKSDPELP